MILSGVHTSSNQPFAAEKLLNMAIKWVSASGKPAAESQPCMLYFFSSKQWITQTWIYCSIDFILHLSDVNAIDADWSTPVWRLKK